ncbi:MAG: methyltransferase domain-containing protein, partial [Parvularcula sp.]|nr:methyltransferase domain-containing protein [Parvularcula sp.]
MQDNYVHGYEHAAASRLEVQARTLDQLLHRDNVFIGETLLEVGCGTGSQTLRLARNRPDLRITAIDRSEASIAIARKRCSHCPNVRFIVADLFDMPVGERSFDNALVCFLLEHIASPPVALKELLRLLRPGAVVSVIEGDHGSVLMHPDSAAARAAIACQVQLQAATGGNANIGRTLYPLLKEAGLNDVEVEPCPIYVDGQNTLLSQGFTLGTFTAMIEGIKDRSLEHGLIDETAFDEGIAALKRTANSDGVFCYTFFRALARVGPAIN